MTKRHLSQAIALLALTFACLTAFPLAAAADEPETDGIIVVLAGDAPGLLSADRAPLQEEVADQLEELGMQVTDALSLADEVVLVARPDDGADDVEAAAAAEALPGVAYAQPNFVYHLLDAPEGDFANADPDLLGSSPLALLAAGVNDPFAQVGTSTNEANQYWLYNANVVKAWELAQCNGAVTVAVADSSMFYRHPDLYDNIISNRAYNACTNTWLDWTSVDPTTNSSHGTHVAGIIAGVANNALGIAGVTHNARILPIVVMPDSGNSTTAYLVNALEFVTLNQKAFNVRVINFSIGSYNRNALSRDGLLEKAIADARNAGIATVCAGGNGAIVNGVRTAQTGGIYPADFDQAVSVTALTAAGGNISWSDYNQYKDISAPGEAIWSTVATSVNTGNYAKKDGTSMAAPVVSGVLALMFAAEPTATVDEALSALYATAQPIAYSSTDATDQARRSTSGTHGAVDASKAVALLIDRKNFTDVKSYAWYTESIAYVKTHDVMNGRASGKFDPNATLTRAEAATVLWNLLADGDRSAPAAPQPDVDQSQWYAPFVNWAIAQELMHGYSSGAKAGLFGPNDVITREQLATIIANAAAADVEHADDSAFNALPDHGTTTGYAVPAMKWATSAGVINGSGTGSNVKLDPQGKVTRATMAAIMLNTLTNELL